MFKLAIFTDELTFDLAHACRVCNEYGVEGVEIRGVWEKGIHLLSDEEVRRVKQMLDDHGLRVCSIGSPFGKCELDDTSEIATHMDYLRRCGDVAYELDCRLIRGFVFWYHDGPLPWDAIMRAYEPVPAILEDKDIVLGIENEAACYVGTAGHLRTFLDRLQCSQVKAVWDPANHIQDPRGDGTPPFPDGYELVKPDLVHVHVKDALVEDEGRPNVFLGRGLAQWEAQLQALKDDRYEGYISLETHVRPDRFPEEWRERYGAHLTGDGREGREAASKVCLAWLRDAMAGLR